MKKLLFISLLLCLSMMASAQNLKVTGTVRDENGFSAPGTYVVLKGSSAYALTDKDGRFSIDIPAGKSSILSISLLGYETKEITVDKAQNLEISLTPDAYISESYIEAAYGGKQTREDLVGSAFQVSGNELKNKPVARVDNLLNGLVPGLIVTDNTDDASSTRTRLQTRIRGEASLSASNEPLWIIDGVIQYTGGATGQMPGMSYTVSPLSYLDPSDIESITVLKDADQVAIYGANGANGVILVTTKSGKKNSKLRINATVKYGVSAPDYSTMFKMMNAQQYLTVAKEAWVNAGNNMSDFPYQDNDYNSYSTTDTNWPSQYLGLGNTFYAQVGLDGGSDKISSAASASYYKENNIVQSDNQQRFTLRLKQTYHLAENLDFGLGLNSSYNINNLFPVSSSSYLEVPPIFSPYLSDGTTYRLYNKVWDSTKGDFVMKQFYYNFLPDREYNDNCQKSAVTKANANLNWKIVKGLELSSVFGFDYNGGHEDVYYARNTLRGMSDGKPLGSSSKKDVSYVSWTNSNILRYNTKIAKNKIEAYAGLEFNSQNNKYTSISGYGFANDRIKEIAYADKVSEYSSTSVNNRRTMSYFGRLSYSYDSRYYFSANIRRDGSSIFGEYSKWGTFWSAGVSWNIHNEPFFKSDAVKMLKLKASFGKSGNSRIDATTATGTYSYSNSYSYMGKSGALLETVPNPGLSWESTYQTNLGVRLELKKNFDIELEYYDNYTKDLLSKVYVSRTISEDRMYANMGCMDNRGVELTIDTSPVVKQNFRWSLKFNASHNDNKITKLYNGRPTSFGSTIWMEGYSSDTYMLIRWAGVDPSDGSPMWYDKEGNLTKSYNYDNRVPGKTSNPWLFGGLTNSFDIYWFTLSFQINYTLGGWTLPTYGRNNMADGYDIMSENQAVEVYYYRWTTPGQETSFPKVSNNTQYSTSYNDRFLCRKTCFKLSNIALSYALPKSLLDKIHVANASVSLICDNAYIFVPGQSSKFNSYKTMMSGYPSTRTTSLSLNLSF